jgi:hypothetical protein
MRVSATITVEMRECAKRCHECKDACLEILSQCLDRGGEYARQGHIVLLLDCAQICNTAEEFMHRGSRKHAAVCNVCSAVCETCADDCDALSAGMPEMQTCAHLCRRCADACLEMAV